ncbi:hypothetical protein ECEPECA12_1594, partial [Escherichia coli EPECa12]
ENWKPISNLHDMSSSHSKTLGYKRLTKSNPISCQILLYKSRSKGRKNQRSTRTHCHHPSPKIYSASAKEPWVLATNLPVEIRTPKQLVNIYSKRMQIEETFRDLKSPAYGLGLRHSRTSSSERFVYHAANRPDASTNMLACGRSCSETRLGQALPG